ncbi:MAG: hypothetical protein GVY08_05765 [Bacteroidetes bacterium]|jgi:hypothetical protein|nr:hypothetical protein [Bacteroidota bacterium]
MKTIKSIPFFLVFALVVSISYAQSGGNHVSNVEQVGEHSVLIEQFGVSNKADILQVPGDAGTGLSGFVSGNPFEKPFSGGSFFSSLATIFQEGRQNISSIKQSGSHEAHIQQFGNGNEADITQKYGGLGSPNLPSGHPDICPPAFTSCNSFTADGSYASIYQKGDNNDADIDQTNGSHTAIIEQWGNGNIAEILQYENQILSSNNGNVQFSNEGQFHKIIQTNDLNTARIIHNNTNLPTTIVQDGNMSVIVEHNP